MASVIGEAVRAEARRGRGAITNHSGRFEAHRRLKADDGWLTIEETPPKLKTTVTVERPKTIITRNKSPDIAFDRSINPYRGCEHGCIYCFARPSHTYMGLSAGLDFETRLFAKPDAPDLLRKELAKPGYKPRVIAIGTNTDPYQPIEKERQIMRQVLEVLASCNHPVSILTKNHMVVRDIDILQPMAEQGLVKVALSMTTLDHRLARSMEPRASTPARRLDALKQLSDVGIPTGVMFAPVIPALNDSEMEAVIAAAARAGVREAGYVTLRLPGEVKTLFREWLATEVPDRARRIMQLMREVKGGSLNDPRFGHRYLDHGPYGKLLQNRFERLLRTHGLNHHGRGYRTDLFCPPQPEKAKDSPQLSLFE